MPVAVRNVGPGLKCAAESKTKAQASLQRWGRSSRIAQRSRKWKRNVKTKSVDFRMPAAARENTLRCVEAEQTTASVMNKDNEETQLDVMDDQKDQKGDDTIDLLVNLKRLTVDLECNKSDVDSCKPTPLNDLWNGEALPKQVAVQKREGGQGGSLKAKSSISEKVRMEPYSLDCLQSLQRLCLSQESCQRPQCSCKRKRREEPAPSSPQSALNLVHAAARQRKVLQDARFRIHKTSKEQRTILHAARLKLKHSSSGAATPTSDICSRSDSLKTAAPLKSPSPSDGPSGSDFAALAASASPAVSRGGGEAKWTSSHFQQYRGSHALPQPYSSRPEPRKRPEDLLCEQMKEQVSLAASSDGASDAVSEELVQPAGKRQCTESIRQGTSCSQEARLDDLSVNELASYFEVFIHIPKKMSYMAEMMYA